MSAYGKIDMSEFYGEVSKGELIDRVRKIEKVIGEEHARAEAAEARAEAAEAELARLKNLLIAWNLELDGTYNQPAYWALCSEASKLAWEAHEALKGGEG